MQGGMWGLRIFTRVEWLGVARSGSLWVPYIRKGRFKPPLQHNPGKCALAWRGRSTNFAAVPDQLCLILETSTRFGTAALADESTGKVIHERSFESDRNHNALMFGPLAKMLAGDVANAITRVIVGAGPGSYSGTRVGIAVAQGIAIARGCPAVAVPSLIGVEHLADSSLAIGDARRGHWWWAQLRGRHMETPAPVLGDAETFRQTMEAAVAEGREIFTFENPEAFTLDVEIRQKTPQAATLWQAWREASDEQRQAWTAAPPQPCYLKPPHITAPKRPWLQG